MSIGSKIFELRTAMNLSQGNLADMLDVSRQSVSKWETDAAVPDLDKLMKLCDVFNVTLDELTCREAKEDNKIPSVVTVVEKEHPMKHQITIGYILLAVSLLAGIIIWIFAESEEDLYIPIAVIFAALACSLICLFVRQNAGYWCAWAVAAPIVLLAPQVVGFSIPAVANLFLIAFGVIMTFIARKLFAKTVVVTNREKSIYLILCWIALFCLRLLAYVLIMLATISNGIAWIPYITMDLISYVGTSLLLTYTVCYLKSLSTKA